MEDIKKVEFNYSLKDIPLANQKEYLIKLYDATSKFINIFFVLNKNQTFLICLILLLISVKFRSHSHNDKKLKTK